MAAASTTLVSSSQFPSPHRRRYYLRSSVVAAAAAAVATPPPASKTGGKTLYEVLRVKETASVREIKAAYRSLAKQAHPDVAPPIGDGEGDGGVDFLEIRRAYETLSDPQERARYDLEFNRVNNRGRLEVFGLGFGLRFAGSGRVGMRRWETDQCW